MGQLVSLVDQGGFHRSPITVHRSTALHRRQKKPSILSDRGPTGVRLEAGERHLAQRCPLRLPNRLLVIPGLGFALAAILGIAAHRIAFRFRYFIVGFALVFIGLGSCVGGLLPRLGIGHRAFLVGLGLLHADVFFVAAHFLALGLCRLVIRLRLVLGLVILRIGGMLGVARHFVGRGRVAQRQADDDGGSGSQQTVSPHRAAAVGMLQKIVMRMHSDLLYC